MNGIILFNRNGLSLRDAPKDCGGHKTLCKRWNEKGVFAQIVMGLASKHGEEKTIMIDATDLTTHRTATSMGVKKRAWTPDWTHQGGQEHCRL